MTQPAPFKLTLDTDTAQGLMTPDPTMLHEDTTLEEAAELFTRCGFSAAPVVDDENRVVGVVSQTDLVREQANPRTPVALSGDTNRDGDEELPRSGGVMYHPSRRVSDVMTPEVFVVELSTPALAVIHKMNQRSVRRLFVVNGERQLVGVISAVDIVKHLRSHI